MRSVRVAAIALVAAGAGCAGGVSESRVAALEAEVNALKDQPPAAKGAGDAAAYRQDVDRRIAELQAADKKMEENLEALGREAMRTSAPAATPPAAAGSDVWAVVAEGLGVPQEGAAKLDGDTYKMSRGWLAEELRLALASKQLPKAVADKKNAGVVVRGVKPKSLFDQLGLKNADVIVEVSGKATATPADLVAALKGAQSPVKVKLQRKGAEVVQQYAFVE